MIDLTPFINAVIALIAAVVTVFIVPWLKTKIEKEKYNRLETWVDVAVHAAEQIFKSESGAGKQKKQYVLDFLKNKGFTVDLDSVDALIEATVKEMNEA